MKRAFQTLTVRSINEERREISGWASRPAIDRMGDVVVPEGASFSPAGVPLLLSHDAAQPVGRVKFGKPTAAGIPFVATIAKVTEPGLLRDRVDLAWQSVKHQIIDSVSIGFTVLDNAVERIETGLKYLRYEILELSLVAVPAAPGATIDNYRSARGAGRVVRLGAPPNAGRVVRLTQTEINRGKVLADLQARTGTDATSGIRKPTHVVRVTEEARRRGAIEDAAKAELEARRRERWGQ